MYMVMGAKVRLVVKVLNRSEQSGILKGLCICGNGLSWVFMLVVLGNM